MAPPGRSRLLAALLVLPLVVIAVSATSVAAASPPTARSAHRPQTPGSSGWHGLAVHAQAPAAAKKSASSQPSGAAPAAEAKSPTERARADAQPPSSTQRAAAPVGRAQPTNAFSSFPGISQDGGFTPSDTTIAAGPSNLVETVNNRIDVYSKVGTQLSDQSLEDLFRPLGQAGQDTLTDPWVVYDPYVNRFWLVAISYSDDPNPHRSHLLLAVSNSSDATQGWSLFATDAAQNGSQGRDDLWCDFPKLGFDTQAIYLTCNMFAFPVKKQPHASPGGFVYAKIRVMMKFQLLAGNGGTWWDFWNESEGGIGDSPQTFEPARMYGAFDGDGEYLVNAHGNGGESDTLEVWHITNPGNLAAPNPSAPGLDQNGRPVLGFAPAPGARQQGSSLTLDTGHTDLRDAVWQHGHLTTGHTIMCPTAHSSCVNYTELDVSSFPTMSTVNDLVIPPDSNVDRFYPAVDVDNAGYKTLVYSVSGPNQHAGAAFTIIPPSSVCTDCVGTETSIAPGLAPFGDPSLPGDEGRRWGDYSGASADPDGDGVWVSGQFAGTAGRWGTEVALTMDRTPTAITYTGPTGANAGDVVDLSASLTQFAAGVPPVPTAGADITFFVGTQVCNATTDANGNAVCPVTLNQPDGTVQVEAEFPGSPQLMPSSSVHDFVIGLAGRHAVRLAYKGPTAGEFQENVILSASLTNPDNGGPISAEPVSFTLGTQSCTGTTDTGGSAACPLVLQQKPGVYTLVVRFGGDFAWSPASVSISFTINKGTTTTVLTSSTNDDDFGQAVTFTAQVAAVNPGARAPTGSVTFQRGSILLGSSPLDAVDDATWNQSLLQVGNNSITASYGGDDYFRPSTGDLTQKVTCSQTKRGTQRALNLTSGSTCLDHATVHGTVTVGAGAAVYVTGSTLDGGIQDRGSLALTICGSTVHGSAWVQGNAKYVLIGDAGDDDVPACAANSLSGSTTIYANQGQVEIGGNQISGSVVVNNNTGSGPDQESLSPEIEANTVNGSLFCNANAPLPVNDGHPNSMTGGSFGQCIGL